MGGLAASWLASFGFICFLIGRVTGAGFLRKASAHKVVGLYAAINVAACFVIDLPELGGAARIEALGVPVHRLVAFDGH